MAQNNKKLCLSHSRAKEAYIIWLWFLVRIYKMMTFPDAFFIFFKFWFFVFLGGEGGGGGGGGVRRQKMTHNCQFQSVTLYISRTVDHSSRFLVGRCKVMISPGVLLYFLKKYSILKIKVLTLFIGPLIQFFKYVVGFQGH